MDEAGAALNRRRLRLATAVAVTFATLLFCAFAWQRGCPDDRSLLSDAMLGIMFALPFAVLIWNGLCLWSGAGDACVRMEDEEGEALSMRATTWISAAIVTGVVLAAGSVPAACGP
jgi:hypothetical protein